MKNQTLKIIFLILIQVIGVEALIAQDRPIRFVIASFVVDRGNDDLKRPFRRDFEDLLHDFTENCPENIEFIENWQEEAIEYIRLQSDRDKREYGIDTTIMEIPIPQQGNLFVLVRIEPDFNGTYLKIGVFERTEQNLISVANGKEESELALNKYYSSRDRKVFIKKAMQDAFSQSKFTQWVSQNIQDEIDASCLESSPFFEEEIEETTVEVMPPITWEQFSLSTTSLATATAATTFISSRNQYNTYDEAYRANQFEITDKLYDSAKSMQSLAFGAGIVAIASGVTYLFVRKRRKNPKK